MWDYEENRYVYDLDALECLKDRLIIKIFYNEDYLQFFTDTETFTFGVEGDCCSNSLFYDFFGVKKLLENGPVLRIEEVPMDSSPDDIVKTGYSYTDRKSSDDDIKFYGFAIITPHARYGEQTSVFSFRNYSNGYYGGNLKRVSNRDVLPQIFADVMETAEVR